MLTKKETPKSDIKSNKTPKTATPESKTAQPLAATPTQQSKDYTVTPKAHEHTGNCCSADKKTQQKTRITVKYDVGYQNQLYIRGKGADLSWEKGQPLKNVKANEWTWETDAPFNQCEFKILINDQTYENGNNHTLHCGSCVIYTPHF